MKIIGVTVDLYPKVDVSGCRFGYAVTMDSIPPNNPAAPDEAGDNAAFGADHPSLYLIRLRGKLPAGWSKWFYDLNLESSVDAEGRPVTSLTGYLPDQAALHGVLERIRDSGLPLLSVGLVEENTGDQSPDARAGES